MKPSVRRSVLVSVPVVVAVLALAAVCVRKPEVVLTMSRDDVQQRVSSKFPIEQKAFLLRAVYSDPVVRLEPTSKRIGLSLTATVSFLEGRVARGRIEGDMSVRYDPDQAALFFDDARFSRLHIEGVSESVLQQVLPLANTLLHERLDRIPVYRLNANDLRHDVARGLLKEVDVQDGHVRFVLGAP